MVIIIGESEQSISAIVKALEIFDYNKVITYTTRRPRENEKNGLDYHFIKKKDLMN